MATVVTAQPVRAWQDTTFPAAGTWVIDPAHTTIEFTVRHLMVAKVKGRLAAFSGALRIAEDPAESTMDVTIEAASIDTREEQRDGHLRSPDFLDAESYPELGFRTARVEHVRGEDWRIHGQLTIRGVSRDVVLETEFLGVTADPWGNDRAVFSARTQIDREDFGLTWNQALEAGGVLVGKDVRIGLEVEAVLER